MREPKFDIGDVVRIVDMEFTRAVFDKLYGKMARVEEVTIRANSNSYWIRTDDGAAGYINEELLEGIPLEEVQRYYADKPRRGFIVDGLTVDELESGQDEAYQTFQRAVKNATAGEWLERAEIRAEHKRLKRKVIMELIGTVAASVGLIGGLIRIAMGGLGLTEVLPALFCAICVSVYAVSYEAGVVKGVCDEMKRIDSKILGQSGDE